MNQEVIILRKTPYYFLKLLVVIELLFATLPLVLLVIPAIRQSYEAVAISRSISYTLLVTLGITFLQILILGITFLFWYIPVYLINQEQITHRRANLFEDRALGATQTIQGFEIHRGPLGKRLGYGNLILARGEAREAIELTNIPNPEGNGQLIQSLLLPAPAHQAALPEPRSIQDEIQGGETQFVEFKSSLMWDYQRHSVNKELYFPAMKSLTAFMNTRGGTLLIGVDDEGLILGLEQDFQAIKKQNVDGWENVFNMAFNKMVGVEFRRYLEVTFPEIEGRPICAIRVTPGEQPAYVRHKGKESFYIRTGNSNQPLPLSKVTAYIQSRF